MCEYSRKEFEEGMASLACDSIDKLRAKLPQLRAELQASPALAACGVCCCRAGWASVWPCF